jgi:uncharacterized membrane protein
MITLEHVYVFAGFVFGAFAVLGLKDTTNPKRFANAAFWGVFAASFLLGSHLPDFLNGLIVIALVVLGGCGFLGHGKGQTSTLEERRASAQRRGNALFIPALIIPATALLGTLFLKTLRIGDMALLDPREVSVISLALGVGIALVVAVLWLKPSLTTPFDEGGRLMNAISWAAVLPQMLASLGAIFALAGVGHAVGALATEYIPLDDAFIAVCIYCIGMAVFTAIMGNAFAAFPVMTAAIGLPLVVHKFGGNPATVAAIGMLSGFCGTLTTPMAANFNVVPAALLELPDRNGVIKAQFPTAIMLLVINTALMYLLAFRAGAHS